MVSANPTGPITVASARNGAYGDSVARLLEFAGHDVEREYYYNDSGAQMDRFRASVEAVRRGEEPPGGRLPAATTSTSSRRCPAIPSPEMLQQHRGRRSSASASTSTRGRSRASSSSELPELLPRARHVREGRRALGALVRVRRRGGPGAHPLGRRHADILAPRTSPTSQTSSSAASTGRSTSSAPTTTARATGTRRSRACSATTPSASRCCSTSSCT